MAACIAAADRIAAVAAADRLVAGSAVGHPVLLVRRYVLASVFDPPGGFGYQDGIYGVLRRCSTMQGRVLEILPKVAYVATHFLLIVSFADLVGVLATIVILFVR